MLQHLHDCTHTHIHNTTIHKSYIHIKIIIVYTDKDIMKNSIYMCWEGWE